MRAPPAEGVRVGWEAVPEPVRAAIEQVCGAPVVRTFSQPGGFSPGVATRAVCADGRRCFIKAVSAQANPDSPGMHRREAQVLRALDPLIVAGDLPVPRLWDTVEEGEWTALVLDDAGGRQPAVPWRPGELARVLAGLDLFTDAVTPSPIEMPGMAQTHGGTFNGWRILASGPGDARLDQWSRRNLDRLAELERDWAAHAAGQTLVHSDIRADNLLLTTGRLMVVDWPHACRGAAFLDVTFFAPSVTMQSGPPPGELVARSRAGRQADPDSVTVMVCALAGFLTERSLRPAPPGLPTLRGFQAAQAEIARDWLAGLLRGRR